MQAMVLYDTFSLRVSFIGANADLQPLRISPVSYTHLDVYKRQIKRFIILWQITLPSHLPEGIIMIHVNLILTLNKYYEKTS